MQSARLIMLKRINVLAVFCVSVCSLVQAQNINSPYSRYGLGDIVPGQNILTRGMGGIGTAYYDYQSVNFLNPASYGRLQTVTLDFGAEIDNLSIRSLNPVRKFSNASPMISYINVGIPLKIKKKQVWGLVFGLRPVTRVSYKILRNERITSGTINDSVATLFEGTGGSQQAFVGTGFRMGNFTAGINAAYLFGSKDYSTRRIFLNDTVQYHKSNHETKTNYNGIFLNAGAQYTAKLNDKMLLRVGVQGNWEQKLKGNQDVLRQTFEYDANSATYQIDSVFAQKDIKGDITAPASYSAGIILDRAGRWLIGIDYSTTKWSKYKFYNETDQVQDSWEMKLGGQLIPITGKNYWSNVAYRTGFSYGRDYVNVGSELPKWTFSIGAGLPMRRVAYTNQFTIINTSLEFGQRGDKSNSIRESFFRFSLGLSMSDLWFIKRKYD